MTFLPQGLMVGVLLQVVGIALFLSEGFFLREVSDNGMIKGRKHRFTAVKEVMKG